MKKIYLILAIGAFIMSGCAQKKPNVTNGDDTVTIDEGGGNNVNGYNSSSDGMQSFYFEFNSFDITSEMQQTVTFNSNVINNKLSGGKIKIEGNCDEFGSDEYNYALGLKRAKAVKDSLASSGVPASNMVVVSLGESNPQCRETTDSCYAKNRRVDLHLAR